MSAGPARRAGRDRLRVALALALLVSAGRFVFEVFQIGARCCEDFPLFWDAVARLREGGRLYLHSKTLADYHSGAPVFKFPPFYAAWLSLGMRLGLSLPSALVLHLSADVLRHLLAAAVAIRALNGGGGTRAALCWIAVLNHGPFFETLIGLQVEVVVLAGLVLMVLLVQRRGDALAGLLVATPGKRAGSWRRCCAGVRVHTCWPSRPRGRRRRREAGGQARRLALPPFRTILKEAERRSKAGPTLAQPTRRRAAAWCAKSAQ